MFRPALTTLLAVFVSFILQSQPTHAAVTPQIAAGYSHTVALMADGTVKQWGSTANWLPPDTVPATVSGLGGTVKAIAANGKHTLALLANGTVKSWGGNSSGQLGDGSTTYSGTPVTVTGLGGTVTAIAAGGDHSLALLADGTVKAWGANDDGKLGNGGTTSSTTPVSVTGLGGRVIAIAAGGFHSLALMEDGTVKAWGYGAAGQLGTGNTYSSSVPVTISSLGGTAIAIAAGRYHSVALMADGSIKAWGKNAYGQLGDGTTTDSSISVTVSALTGKGLAISAGENHTVALMDDNTIRTWGSNQYGQLGDGTASERSTYPVPAFTGMAAAIAAGWNHTVLVRGDGTVMAWGANEAGQLGIGTTNEATTPIPVEGVFGSVAGISAYWDRSMAVMGDGSVKGWGYNGYNGSYSVFGAGAAPVCAFPVDVPGFSGAVAAVAQGENHAVALMADGTVTAWGDSGYGQTGPYPDVGPSSVDLGGIATAVAAGAYHSLALMSDGSVKAWGLNVEGQLGDGTNNTMSYFPVVVSGLGGPAIAIAAYHSQSFAVLADGTVKGWGANANGQLGDGTTVSTKIPVTVADLGGPATAIAAGGDYTAALLQDGTVKQWGWHPLWDGTNATPPRTIAGFTGAVSAIAAGDARNVALMTDGTVMEWGYQWGNQREAETALPVAGLTQVTAVSAGGRHSLALMGDGTVKGWGRNNSGQLGYGNWTMSPQPSLLNVDNVPPVVSVDKPSGSYAGSVTVSLTCSDNLSGCTGIYYTLDNSTPTTESTPAIGPVTVSATAVLKYIAIDAASNTSPVNYQSYQIVSGYTLFVTSQGSNNGTFSTSASGYGTSSCGEACSFGFAPGTVVTVTPSPAAGYGFFGWSGCDSVSGNACTVTMTGERLISASWAPTNVNVEPTSSIAAMYAALPDSGTLKLRNQEFTEDLVFDRDIIFSLKGGYGGDFMTPNGVTIIHGSMTVRKGMLVPQNLIIAP